MEVPNQNYEEFSKVVDELRSDVPPRQPTGFLRQKAEPVVTRETRHKNAYLKQTKLYSPCTCGSGKKYKFCCNGKQMVVIDTGA